MNFSLDAECGQFDFILCVFFTPDSARGLLFTSDIFKLAQVYCLNLCLNTVGKNCHKCLRNSPICRVTIHLNTNPGRLWGTSNYARIVGFQPLG